MAGVSGVALAVAAMRGGAVGSLPCAMLTPIQVIVQAADVRDDGRGGAQPQFLLPSRSTLRRTTAAWREVLAPFYQAEGVVPRAGRRRCAARSMRRWPRRSRRCEPEIVSFHFGLPAPDLLARVRNERCALIFGNATSPDEMRWLADAGVDAIVVQGSEAGGHAGWFLDRHRPTPLAELLAIDVPVPKIAAGGIVDAADIATQPSRPAQVRCRSALPISPRPTVQCEQRRTARCSARRPRRCSPTCSPAAIARGPAQPADRRDRAGQSALAPPFPHASAALAPLRATGRGRGPRRLFPVMGRHRREPACDSEPAEALTRRLATETLALLESA